MPHRSPFAQENCLVTRHAGTRLDGVLAGDIACELALSGRGCQRVGTVQIVVPDAPGPLALVLHCRHSGQQVDNRYEATIRS